MMKGGRSRLDSITDDISRAESKAGESTIESDKLANILKSKEDNIRLLMQQLKNSDQSFEPKEFEEDKEDGKKPSLAINKSIFLERSKQPCE